MIEPTESISDNGDRWVVRECDDTYGCTVVERFRCKSPPTAFDRAIARLHGAGEHSDGEPDEEPAESIHVPRDMLAELAARLGGLAQAASRHSGRPEPRPAGGDASAGRGNAGKLASGAQNNK